MSMILILAVIFLVLMLLVGGERGAISFIALCGNAGVLVLAILLMTAGFQPILITIAATVFINAITLVYQNGRNKKTFAALISAGVMIVVLFFFVFILTSRMHLAGLNEIDLQGDFPVYYSFNIHINMAQVAVTMIIIGLLGAVMDTAVAVASALYEVHFHTPGLSQKELFHSGIAIGKDILATTLNTLYFAYIGESMMLLLYLQKYNYSFVSMMNSKAFLEEFTCIMVSAIGCMLIIPLSAAVSARMYGGIQVQDDTKMVEDEHETKLAEDEHETKLAEDEYDMKAMEDNHEKKSLEKSNMNGNDKTLGKIDITKQKKLLRQEVKKISASLTDEYRREADARIADKIIAMPEYQSASTIFCFVSMPGELDTSDIFSDAFAKGKRVGVPKCISKGVMKVYEIQSLDELEEAGAYHILEPIGKTGKEEPGENGCIDPEEIAFAVVPCVSCSKDGKRLGHGGGFYDRYLAQTQAYKAVVCRGKEMREDIPEDVYDLKMDAVVTE